jgi:hypothetical protein
VPMAVHPGSLPNDWCEHGCLSRCRGLGHKRPTLVDDEVWLGVVVLSGFEAILLRDFENYGGEVWRISCAIATTSKLRFERSGTASVVHSIRSW